MIKILIIEDNKYICNMLKNWLEEKKYHVYTSNTGRDGIKLVRKVSPNIVFLDTLLKDVSCIKILKKIKEFEKSIRIIVLESKSSKKLTSEIKKLKVTDFVKKPFTIDYLENVVMSKIYSKTIEHQKDTMIQVIYALADALEAKDKYTMGHSNTVSKYIDFIAHEIKTIKGWEWVHDKIRFLKNAALLHDIGKMGVRDGVLNKPGKLTNIELQEMRKHPLIGSHILSIVEDLKGYIDVVRYHHERWDGNGYPEKLKNKDIPKEARIISVCDAFSAMTSVRPYRKAMSDKKAIKELEINMGTQFDPDIIKAFFRAIEKFEKKNKIKIV